MSPKCYHFTNLAPTCNMPTTLSPCVTAGPLHVAWCSHNALSPRVHSHHTNLIMIVPAHRKSLVSIQWCYHEWIVMVGILNFGLYCILHQQLHQQTKCQHARNTAHAPRPPINQRPKQRTMDGRNHSGITHYKHDALSNRSSPKASVADHPIGTMVTILLVSVRESVCHCTSPSLCFTFLVMFKSRWKPCEAGSQSSWCIVWFAIYVPVLDMNICEFQTRFLILLRAGGLCWCHRVLEISCHQFY